MHNLPNCLTKAAKWAGHSCTHSHVSLQLVLSEDTAQSAPNGAQSLHELALDLMLFTSAEIYHLKTFTGREYTEASIPAPMNLNAVLHHMIHVQLQQIPHLLATVGVRFPRLPAVPGEQAVAAVDVEVVYLTNDRPVEY